LEGVVVVPTFDLPLTDGIHTSPAGNLLLGERMARAALGMVYGQPVDYLAPDLQMARRDDRGMEIELSFAPVTSRIDTIDRLANPFRVEDETGEVPVAEVAYPCDHRIVLRLERGLHGQARVSGAYGFNPTTVPMDMERVLPILGFYDVSVT
jgi:hypothetical protein